MKKKMSLRKLRIESLKKARAALAKKRKNDARLAKQWKSEIQLDANKELVVAKNYWKKRTETNAPKIPAAIGTTTLKVTVDREALVAFVTEALRRGLQ